MRDRSGSGDTGCMQRTTPKQRVILDAAIDRSVIHGTLTAPSGGRRDFHGWLELNTALEATLDARAGRAPGENPAVSAAVRANARDTRPNAPVTKSVNRPPGDPAPSPARPAR